MMEAAVVLINHQEPVYWHTPEDRTTAALPDSSKLWGVLWENRHQLYGVAHSHPGGGVPGPSHVDVTTFAGLEKALGKRLTWPIITVDACVLCEWMGPGKLDYRVRRVGMNSLWAVELLKLSGLQHPLQEVYEDG